MPCELCSQPMTISGTRGHVLHYLCPDCGVGFHQDVIGIGHDDTTEEYEPVEFYDSTSVQSSNAA